jgi:excisionase family DNA binding protein
MTPHDDLLSYEAAAARLSVSVRTLQALVADRQVPHLRVGRFVRFDGTALDTWARGRLVVVPPTN